MSLNLAKEALIASGISDPRLLEEDMGKLVEIFHHFIAAVNPPREPMTRAKALFQWLWERKPSRYKPQGPYRISEVIHAQRNPRDSVVGNCLGLTLLYNCLLAEGGIHAEALHLEGAFEKGIPHVLTLLREGESTLDVENILPNGFDYRGHLWNPTRTRWGERELAADVYMSAGNDFFAKEEFDQALQNYERAIQLNPTYEKARLNRIILLDKMGRTEKDST